MQHEKASNDKKVCLVLGSALNLWNDVETALSLGEYHGVVAAKRAGVHWPGELDALVSLHPDMIPKMLKDRAAKGYPAPKHVISNPTSVYRRVVTDQMEFLFDGQRHTGSSGLFAVKVALTFLGFGKAVLCGMPFDSGQGKIDFGPKWNGSSLFHKGFQEALPVIKHRARSMSGLTREWLGPPTSEWLGAQS